ncbi:hypothetical protein MOBT1_001093 [Malassezia obtusa]|uniref:SRP9 domain-containing protein n=1 Tax=Malassezia obtusa TaxID=76774 RepID=A0AAF0DZD1_9BASI|nr:hypothetical protein MOBT1_001093 [Malassezia obtusa]
MVYLKHWNDFKAQALALYAQSPERARFVLKARPSTQTLVLKLTDDHKVRRALTQTLKYRAKSAIILNRLDEFQRMLLERMSGVAAAPAAPAASAAPAAPAAPAEASTAPAPDTTPKAPAKSKNKKKGKKK